MLMLKLELELICSNANSLTVIICLFDKHSLNQINKFWILSTNYWADKWVKLHRQPLISYQQVLSFVGTYFIEKQTGTGPNYFYNLHNIISVMHGCSPVENQNDLELDFKVFFFVDSCCWGIVLDESIWCHSGIIERFEIFKMASKMAVS